MVYSIDAALKSKLFHEVMVSTDSDVYADIAKNAGANVPFFRSTESSSDFASSWDTVREVLTNYKEMGQDFDTVCLLQPTSPLRKVEDITNAYRCFSDYKADSVIGVCEAEHSPIWINTLPKSMRMDNFVNIDAQGKGRQELGKYYRINGAVYIVYAKTILENRSIYYNSIAYIMPQKRSIDIDCILDFKVAEVFLQEEERVHYRK